MVGRPLGRGLRALFTYGRKEGGPGFLDAGVRVVTSPEFHEYVANDIRRYDFAYEGVAD